MTESSQSLNQNIGFESALEQLTQIIKKMESGEMPLEQSIALFEQGMKLSQTCQMQLADAEKKVELLMSTQASPPQFQSMPAHARAPRE